MTSHLIIWTIAILSVAGVIIHPYNLPEAIWVVTGSLLLLVMRLILPVDALAGIEKGTDVYLFLLGMMLLAEIAREEKLFEWLAAHAINYAKGSSTVLFLLIYIVGIIVTAFLSNDATAVVLTPAVAAAVKSAKVKKPLPYLFICAFIANAASFILPISNPANLVIYGSHMPPLLQWLSIYFLPSLLAISITYILLFWRLRHDIKQNVEASLVIPSLSREGKTAGIAIMATAIILLTCSSFGIQLGLPTAIAGIFATLVVLVSAGKKPWVILKGVSWSILPLVAGLFILVEALDKTGLITSLSSILKNNAAQSATLTATGSGSIIAFATNLTNNLPAGLIAGNVVQAAGVSPLIKHFILVGVDLGPNLSVTGSLATILWLVALRREGENVSALAFLKLGIIIMIPALLAAFAALLI
jgi:arsenical pump membrane protein